MLLFLDFDGVLHPDFQGQTVPVALAFCHLPRFEDVMRDFPSVDIVISSAWRAQFSLENLRARFSSDIALRIIDTTSVQTLQGSAKLRQRELEILIWLAQNNRVLDRWVALDDSEWMFRDFRHNLVACLGHVGFDSVAERRLRAALSG